MAYTVQDLAPIALGQCMRNQKTLSADAVVSAFNNMAGELDLALAASQAEGRMFVFRDGTKYVDQGQIKNYGSLAEAMSKEPEFKGYAYIAEDIDRVSSFSGEEDKFFVVSRRLVLDFNGRTVSCDISQFAEISSDSAQTAAYGLPDFTLRNGNLVSDRANKLFEIRHGSLKFENMRVETDCSSADAYIVRFHATENPDFIKKQYVSADKDTELVMRNCKDNSMFLVFTPYFRLVAVKNAPLTRAEYNQKLIGAGLTEEDVAPELFLDCRCRMDPPDTGRPIVTPQYEGDFDPIYVYPQLVDNNGSDKGVAKVTVGTHAYLNAGDGIGIYSGMNIQLRLEGGTIIGGTGIAMRSGTLIVPADSDPIVIGSGQYRKYVPYHTSVFRRQDGGTPQKGSDAQMFLNLGHAVVLENNGDSYGIRPVSAYIGSGKFVSYGNTPFGSYSIGMAGNSTENGATLSTFAPSCDLSVNGGTSTFWFPSRLTGFVEACETNRPSIGLEYILSSGQFPDWRQTAPDSMTRSGCQTYKAVPYVPVAAEPDLETLIPH